MNKQTLQRLNLNKFSSSLWVEGKRKYINKDHSEIPSLKGEGYYEHRKSEKGTDVIMSVRV